MPRLVHFEQEQAVHAPRCAKVRRDALVHVEANALGVERVPQRGERIRVYGRRLAVHV